MLFVTIAQAVACAVHYLVDSVGAHQEYQACMDALNVNDLYMQTECLLMWAASEAYARLDYAACFANL